MDAKWKQSDQTLTVDLGGGILLRLFAIGFLIGGGYFAYYLVLGVYEYVIGFLRGEPGIAQNFIASIPGILLTIFMMLMFGIPGVLLLFGRKRVVIDRAAGTITEMTDYGFFKRKQEHPVTEFQTVEVTFAAESTNKSQKTLFDVKLRGKRKESVLVAVVDEDGISQALELAKQIATLLDYKMREDIGGFSPTAPAGSSKRGIFRKSALPDLLLGSVMWKFDGTSFNSRASFDRAVRKYQTDQGEDADDWEPDKIALAVPQVAIQYECQAENGAWVKPIVEFTAEDGKQFTNGELFFQLHNAIVDKLRALDNNQLQGLDLVDAEWKENVPLYVVNQVE
jgi:hypothetical protein